MKIVKKIVMIIFLISIVALDIWIIKDFEEKTVRTGIIDKNEKMKVKMEYSSINAVDLSENYEYMLAFKEDIFGNLKESLYIDLNGNEYYNSSLKNEKPEYYQNRAATYSISIGKEGYIDWKGNKVSQFIYDYTDNYKNGYAKVGIYDNEELKYGVIDLDGNQIIQCIYKDIDMDSSDSDIFYVEENDITYIVNKDNIKIAEYTENGKLKFIDLEELTDLGEVDAENVRISKNYILICGENGKYGFFTREGKKKSDFKYDTFESISSQDLFLVEELGKRYIIDNNLNIVLNTEMFDKKGIEIDTIENGRIKIKKNNKYGIADLNGNIIIEPEYESISIQTAKNGYFSVMKDNKYGVIDLNGNKIIECSKKYKEPILGSGEYFVVKEINIKLLTLWIVILIVTFIIEIILVRQIFRRNKIKKR